MSTDKQYIVGIDPGNTRSAWVVIGEQTMHLYGFGREDNETVLDNFRNNKLTPQNTWMEDVTFVLEKVESYGMAVGADVFETVFWTGRFYEAISRFSSSSPIHRVGRKAVKLHLCGTTKAKDANVRQALIDRYGPGKERAIGTKKAPGPLYGVSNDVWAALAVAVAYAENL